MHAVATPASQHQLLISQLIYLLVQGHYSSFLISKKQDSCACFMKVIKVVLLFIHVHGALLVSRLLLRSWQAAVAHRSCYLASKHAWL
jgi:hypothetical protein